MGCLVPPGDFQVDTFALGGGDPSENFFWILTGIGLRHRIFKRLRGIIRKQEEYARDKRQHDKPIYA